MTYLRLNKNKKHFIEAVIDRVKVPEKKEMSDDFRLRLSESVENALTLGEDSKTLDLDNKDDEITYSSKMACPKCGYSIPELEPRLFTFNNPSGACPDCEGLGIKPYVDEKRIIYDERFSIQEGAIRGWDINRKYHYHMMKCLSKQYNFSLEEPFSDLNTEIRDLILNGSNGEIVGFSWTNKRGRRMERFFCIRRRHQ